MALEDTVSNLDDHRRLATEALHDLRALKRHAAELGVAETAARLDDVLARMEGEVFRIAVVGEFKRGKSTLINALLGQEILPADVLPCSATLNRVTYGLTPSVRLVFKPDSSGHRRVEQIAPDKLTDYVTKLTPDSEKRASDIEEAIVSHPIRFCRDKADIIDTPGLNDDEAMTQVTMRVLPGVDAALFVILAQSPFSGYEADFLSKLLTQDLGRVIFVVNRIDEIRREADRGRILTVVRERIEKAVRTRAAELHGEGTPDAAALIARIGRPRVFGVSGADALEARLNDDPTLLEKSGFVSFEAALERFLAVERGVVTLCVIADTATTACRNLSAQASIRRGALAMQGEEFEAAYEKTSVELGKLRGQLKEELGRLDASSRHLRDTLRPRARALPHILMREANAAIDAFPLENEALAKARVEATVKQMSKAVLDRVQAAGRLESERLQSEIEKGLQAEVARLVDFGARVEQELSAIELRFNPPTDLGGGGPGAGTTAGFGAVAGALARLVPGGALLTGSISGAVTGYQVAGMKGAAAGAAAGVVSGVGAIIGGAMLLGAIGVTGGLAVIPLVIVSGVASSLGARWFTRLMFGEDQLKQFRESFRNAVLTQLEQDSVERVSQIEKAVDDQVSGAFTALRGRVRAELGGLVEQTQLTLDDLRTRRTQAATRTEQELEALDALVADTTRIDARMRALVGKLRALDEAT